MNSVTIKRSPIVLIRTLVAIEALAFAGYLLAVALGNYKYELYTNLLLSSILPYQIAKLFLLSGAQLVITIYAFFRWYYESYTFRPGEISYARGVVFKKITTVPLDKTTSLTLSSGPVGKLLHYGSIHVKNSSFFNSLFIRDISYPQKNMAIIKQCMNSLTDRTGVRPDVPRLMREGEHEKLEFKSSLRFDHHTNQINRELEKAALKTVTAFLNSKGGNLVIGIGDSGQPLGLSHDYKTLKRPDSDGFENHFTQVFNSMIGPEFRNLVRLWFDTVEGQEVCVVCAASSPRPVYLKLDNDEQFYVRTGNVTTPLKLSEIESYARTRWPGRTRFS